MTTLSNDAKAMGMPRLFLAEPRRARRRKGLLALRKDAEDGCFGCTEVACLADSNEEAVNCRTFAGALPGGIDMKRLWAFVRAVGALALVGCPSVLFGQGYGTDTQNVLSPASGGMAGVSIAQPQDVPSAGFGNPATLSQFQGTQFTPGGAWVEGYPTVTRFGLPNGNDNFSATSRTQGFVNPDIAATQDLRTLGLNGTFGLGLAGTSGLGAEYRGQAPAGSLVNDFSTEYMVLGVNAGAGFDLTDRLSIGASGTVGTGFEQLGLVSNSAMVHDYGVRGSLGVNYKLNPVNTLGAFYQTKESFQFPNAVFINGAYHDIRLAQPDTFGVGLANRRLMGGDLLLAADLYYKLWEDAPGYSDIFVNQWALAFGAQLTRGRTKYRLGYSYNSNPINHNVGSSFSGLPVLQDRIYLLQASETAAINQHRLTAGLGRQDFLFQGLDLDVFAGGMLNATDDFGPNTKASVALYYVGMGLTWRFGPCQCRCTDTVEQVAVADGR
jgi:long-chain fatty acid transport protein